MSVQLRKCYDGWCMLELACINVCVGLCQLPWKVNGVLIEHLCKLKFTRILAITSLNILKAARDGRKDGESRERGIEAQRWKACHGDTASSAKLPAINNAAEREIQQAERISIPFSHSCLTQRGRAGSHKRQAVLTDTGSDPLQHAACVIKLVLPETFMFPSFVYLS